MYAPPWEYGTVAQRDQQSHLPGDRTIQARTFGFAVRVVRLCRWLVRERDIAATGIARQLLRSGTSIGACVQEAQSAESRADFVHKMTIAQKEARESLFWLKLLAACGLVQRSAIADLTDEADGIVAVLTSIIVRTKHRSKSR
jgi:four helix bundle protein